jgi:dienelactone hydrolase
MIARTLALVLFVALAAGCASGPALTDASRQLRPHDALYRPDGAGPFPAVVVLHGCLGVRAKDTRWAESIRDAGYVSLVVDSMTGRGITTLQQRQSVCQGAALWGGARAKDVAASLAYLRTLPFVDGSRLAVVGFSHGGWAAFDFLSTAQPEDVHGLRGLIAFYPYCGVASKARWVGWQVNVPTLVLLAERDRMISTPRCRKIAEREAAGGRPVSVIVYPDVGHAFDWRQSPATDDARKQVAAFLATNLQVRHAGTTR